MPPMDPRNVDVVAAMLTIPVAYKLFDAEQEGKQLEHEFKEVVENYSRMRRLLEEECYKPSCTG